MVYYSVKAKVVIAVTIKDMEIQTGMSRANIRYYEAEGLIMPQRRENGYRFYSQEDAALLMKIKLLRCLGLPLEDIKQLQCGDAELQTALKQHLDTLSQQQNHLHRAERTVHQILAAEESFDTLQAASYLLAMENTDQALRQDVVPRLNLPWRRYWARCFDFALYSSLLDLLVLRLNISAGQGLIALSYLLAMLLTEPLLLHLFGTTPGKAIFGIRVTDPDGGHLSYGDGLERTWLVLWEGEGLRIPLVTLYFHYKSYTAVESGNPLPWEKDSELTISDAGNWRYVVYAGAVLTVLALLIWIGV